MVNKTLVSFFAFLGLASAVKFPRISRYRHGQFSGNIVPNDDSVSQQNDTLPEKYGPFTMTMPLNHFDTSDSSAFENRYWVNTDYYAKDGPIILSNGGEAAVDDESYIVFESTMAQLAERLGGILVHMEHRYYGPSGPKSSDYTYLKVDQALADMAYLIQNIKFNESLHVPPVPETKMIVYGCSYSGNLAAWLRAKYPDLTFAAVASSAPVQAQLNFYQYFNPIIQYAPKKCIQAIQDVITYVDSILFGNSTSAVDQLKKTFGAQGLYDDDFASLLSGPFGEYWQNSINSSYNGFEDILCKNVFNSSSTEKNVEAFGDFINSSMLNQTCRSFDSINQCLGTHNITDIRKQMEQSPDSASWTWQTCSEFGYFQVAAPADKPTLVSRKLQTSTFERPCQLYFGVIGGVPDQPPVDQLNQVYGGWNVRLDRVIWVDGEWDSWRELSVQSEQLNRQTSSNETSIIIPRATHCANFFGITKETPQYMIDIQDQQYRTLKAWLEQGN